LLKTYSISINSISINSTKQLTGQAESLQLKKPVSCLVLLIKNAISL